MPLDAADLNGFDAASLVGALLLFDPRTAKRGLHYFRTGAVHSLLCVESGVSFVASVQGGDLYEVSLNFNAPQKQWINLCSCPMGSRCKHAYAAMKQLQAEHAAADVQALSSSSRSAGVAVKPAPPPPPPKPVSFEELVRDRLNRKLTLTETSTLRKIHSIWQNAQHTRRVFGNDLHSLGLANPNHGWWDRVDLWPSFPKDEAEFWNYLALYSEEHHKPIPEFLRPVTDLDAVRDRMRRYQRAQEIQLWAQQLSNLGPATATGEDEAPSIELRVRFLAQEAMLEWRAPGQEWAAIKKKKARDFDSLHGGQLSAEAALIWQPVLHRAETYYDPALRFGDSWARTTIGRWLRQPALRSMLVDAEGEPLVFQEAPLRWSVSEPSEEDGDYSLQLIRAESKSVPFIRAHFDGQPVYYLTDEGVFTGPPTEMHLLHASEATRIPAKAFETPGGLRLLDRLNAEPPPRLAARVRTVPLRPRVMAELKSPWAGSETEYCYVDVLGASDDGQFVERWNGQSWTPASDISAYNSRREKSLTRVDRSAVAPLPALVSAANFKWEYHFARWSVRLTKKFPEQFVPFLKSLPPGTTIELRGELASFQNAEVAGRIKLQAVEAGIDWFDLSVLVDVNDTTLTKEEIKLLLDARGKWVRLGAKGWRKLEFKLSEEEDKELARLGLTPHQLTSEPQRLHALQLADKAARRFLPEDTCAQIERRAAELQARVTPGVPVDIKAEMRPYQHDGFHFLAYLSTNRFGGILADDMGLGKTLQTLAWLAWLRSLPLHSQPSTINSSLVVCPKSVADNWRAEAERFFPSLAVKVWQGSALKLMPARLSEAALHVLNYTQLRALGDDLARAEFLAVILDEGQYIKNPASVTAMIARRLRAEHRLVLSGTPIENRLLDLWSLMSFAMPGALGSRAEFGRLYDAKEDPFARSRLSARVRPFLIRRTKSQVARDLPDRVEEDLFCEIEGEQKTLYRAELKRAQQLLLGMKTPAALNKQRFNVLTSLLRLRQICCHPKLVKPDSKAAAAKVEALIETLEPLMDEGEKVLVFSQFVEMLELLRAAVREREWRHWYLAGDTENRGDLVREFQSAEGAGVFFISLKAGGFGLNLTAASYVILFDPWWNPAVENQAIDRTHRIGQARKVIAYRLLIKDSIEEKIRTLQRQKKVLAEDVLGEEKFSQGLNLEDLRFLLA
jgi:hypothetical protein